MIDSHPTFAWKNSAWLPTSAAQLDINDIGFLQGVVIVDRLRTVAGVPLDSQPHVDRFARSCLAVGIHIPPRLDLPSLLQACVDKNRAAYGARDFSLVLLATPGPLQYAGQQPTLIVHSSPIDWRRLQVWYQTGQPLHASTHRNVPSACWSPTIKTRARLQYYLADQQAARQFPGAHAAGLLLSTSGSLTETSSANLLVVEDRVLVSPPVEQILPGISLERTRRLAQQAGYQVVHSEISLERAMQADGILLCGSTGCLWPASRLNDRRFPAPAQQAAYQTLRQAWCDALGFDIVAQAQQLVHQRA